MKRRLVSVILSLSIMFVFLTTENAVSALEFENVESHETVLNTMQMSDTTEVEISNSIKNIEKDLLDNGTDVLSELEKQISRYQLMLESTETKEQINQIKSLIDTTETLAAEYEMYQNGTATRGDFHIVYSSAVASVVAYFNSKDYDLSAELLTHAKENNDLDSIYTPILQNDVLSSSVFNSIKNGVIYEGSNSFPNSGTTNDEDLYYAIHSFYYTKSESGSVVVIQDRYDFAESDFSSIGNVAINVMHKAQEAGVLVPYYSVITQKVSTASSNQSGRVFISSGGRYFEQKVTLGPGEYKEISITFDSSSSRVFQTFGMKDTYLYLYDSNGNLLASNDDNGYLTNALIKYYCNANTEYILKIEFFSSLELGETKLSIMPATGALKSDSSTLNTYQDIYNASQSSFAFNTFHNKGYVRLITYTPPKKGYYTVKTEGSVDTYLYLIDPRSTYCVDDIDGGCNDDSETDVNAVIYRELSANIPYLVIYSKFHLYSDDANFLLRITLE